MLNFRTTKEVNAGFSAEILSGALVPHATSWPMIRREKAQLVLCAFCFSYTADDLRAGGVDRPSTWATADMQTGEMIEVFDCRTYDFTDAAFGAKYSTANERGKALGPDYFESLFALLDEVRAGYLQTGALDIEAYRCYFTMMLAAMPPAYEVFYRDLGSPDKL